MKYKIVISFRSIAFGWICLMGVMGAKAQRAVPTGYTGLSPAINYIRTWDAVAPEQSGNSMMTRPLQDVKMSTQYLDGLGRPLQTVLKQGSFPTGGTATDLVSSVEYDEFGRERFSYSSYAEATASNGAFKDNPFANQASFMNQQYGTQNETWFYSQVNFEASPLNRVEKTMAPGNNWVGSSRGTEMKYWINTAADSVRIWAVSDNSGGFGTYSIDDTHYPSGIYPAGSLYKNTKVDEHGKQVIEFKDKQGKIILNKVQLNGTADNGNGVGYTGWLSTYYIYDNFNNLRCVIQPEGVKAILWTWSLTATLLNEQCFRYEYDLRDRMIKKKVPGAGEVWMVYDQRNRLVMTQDANTRGQQKWMYTTYDGLNRPVSTGFITDPSNYANHSNHLGAASTSIAYPIVGNYANEELTKTFYDDYTWLSSYGSPLSSSYNNSYDTYFQTASGNWPYAQTNTQSVQLKDATTGSRIKVLGTSTYLYTVSFYDAKGRIIQVQSTNISGGTDITTTQYSWGGQPLVVIQKEQKAGGGAQTSVIVTQMTYDYLGRLAKTEKKVSNTLVNSGSMPGSYTTISDQEYDALGQLKKKTLGAAPIETLTYEYNIRGWNLGMNRSYVKDTNSTTNRFGYDLGYDKTSVIVNGTGHSYTGAQYNGNINGMLWRSSGDGMLRKYDFTYDATNRFLSAEFNQLNSNNFSKAAGIDFSVSGMSYDANGNILNMNQKGWKLGGSVTIDSLLYGYIANTNRLYYVHDRTNDMLTKLGDFKEYTDNTSQDYSYDPNGNLIADNNKAISSIVYNHLNLPDSVIMTGMGSIKYVYDATGNKLKKVVREGAYVTTTLYLAGNYTNDLLQFINTEEGRVRIKSDNSEIVYDYMIKDYLGNVRMILTEEKDTAFYPPASMESATAETENFYYANLDKTRSQLPPGYLEDTYTDPNEYVAKLNATDTKIGPSIVLKVMAGDSYNLRASSWYHTQWDPNAPPNPPSPINILSELMDAMGLSLQNVTKGVVTTEDIAGSALLLTEIDNFLDYQITNSSSSLPKAYINWIFLDDQFNYIASSSGFEQIDENNHVLKIHSFTNVPITKNGYLYVYVSNATEMDVYFDNLQVTHIRGPLVSEEHYYPFGLTQAGISSNALGFGGVENKKKFNGYEQQHEEFSDGNGLEWYDYKNRFYDNQIGRFFVQDGLADEFVYYTPYQFAGNEVPNAIDLDGLEPVRQNQIPIDKVNPWALAKLGKFIPKDDGLSLREGIKNDFKLAAIFTSAFGVGIVADAIAGVTLVSEAPSSQAGTGNSSAAVGEAVSNVGGAGKTGKAANRLNFDKEAQGDHFTFKRDNNKNIYKYQEWIYNDRNPNKFDPGRRFDGGKPDGSPGAPHRNKNTGEDIPTPHINDKKAPGGGRLPEPWEIPQNRRFINPIIVIQ